MKRGKGKQKQARSDQNLDTSPQELWRDKAQEMLPEIAEVNDAENPMQAWIEIDLAFDIAYDDPRNEDLIRRIYGFARWCVEHGERTEDASTDPLTCVAVCFYEHIPNREASRLDMPRWFTKEEVVYMKQTFSYHLNPDEWELLLKMWDEPATRKRKK